MRSVNPAKWAGHPHRFPIIKTVIGIFFLLDLIMIFGTSFSRDNIGYAFCFIRPIDILATPLIPSEWTNYIRNDCGGDLSWSDIRIYFFIIKTSVCVATFGFGVAILIFSDGSGEGSELLAERGTAKSAVAALKAVFQEYKALAIPVGIPLLIFIFVLFSYTSETPAEFGGSPPYRILLEDATLLCGCFLGLVLLEPAFTWIVRPLARRLIGRG